MSETKHEIRVGDEGRGKSLQEARDALVDGPKETDRVRDAADRRLIASYVLPSGLEVARSILGHAERYPDAEVRVAKDKKTIEVWSHPKS